MRTTSEQSEIGKGLIAGLVAGAVGAWVMNQFQALLSKKLTGVARSHGGQSLQQGSPPYGAARELQNRGVDRESDDATMRTAQFVSETAFDHELSDSEKDRAGTVAHYAMAGTSGLIYGGLAEISPAVTIGMGIPFGAAVWLVADEGIVPLLGLSEPATEYPLEKHGYAIASHLVYGLATELARRSVRRMLDATD